MLLVLHEMRGKSIITMRCDADFNDLEQWITECQILTCHLWSEKTSESGRLISCTPTYHERNMHSAESSDVLLLIFQFNRKWTFRCLCISNSYHRVDFHLFLIHISERMRTLNVVPVRLKLPHCARSCPTVNKQRTSPAAHATYGVVRRYNICDSSIILRRFLFCRGSREAKMSCGFFQRMRQSSDRC